MWLLDTNTARLHEFKNNAIPPYAILSHVWQEYEQSFQEVQSYYALSPDDGLLPVVCSKIRLCCEVARADGFKWVWIDTCCINKSSSADLSEAINSMYTWYANAAVCYAFLHDVDDSWDPEDQNTRSQKSPFGQSAWFTRGWTLQELIAPRTVIFLSSSWRIISTKESLAHLVENITGIGRAVLLHERPLEEISIAQRMSWAAARKTTREEDRAYSLMGIFGVYMPTIYGEGANAFFRLQEEILKRSSDRTIFLWGPRYAGSDPLSYYSSPPLDSLSETPTSTRHLALASSPNDFAGYNGSTAVSQEDLAQLLGLSATKKHNAMKFAEYRLTVHGMLMAVPLLPLRVPLRNPDGIVFLAILPCKNERNELAALLLHEERGTTNRYYVGAFKENVNVVLKGNPIFGWPHLSGTCEYFRSVFLPPSLIRASTPRITEVILHAFPPLVPTAPTRSLSSSQTLRAQPATFAFLIHHRVLERLLKAGFHLGQEEPAPQRCRDGILLEVSQEVDVVGGHRKTWAFTFLMTDFPDPSSSNSEHQHPGTSSTTMEIRITIGAVPCSSSACKAQAWQYVNALSGAKTSVNAPWLTVDARQVTQNASSGRGWGYWNTNVQFPPNSNWNSWAGAVQAASSQSTVAAPEQQQQSEPANPQFQFPCPRGRMHLPQSRQTTLQFGNDQRSVELDFRSWDGYRHRNNLNATFQYTINVWFGGNAIGPGHAGAGRTQHAPTAMATIVA